MYASNKKYSISPQKQPSLSPIKTCIHLSFLNKKKLTKTQKQSSMAEAAVATLLENISQLQQQTSYGADLISGAEAELHLLKKDLALIKAFLRDEARKPKEEREMEREVEEAAYEVEDAIEICLAKATEKNLLRRSFLVSQTGLAKEVRLLREGVVKKLVEKLTKYISADPNNTTVPPPPTRPTKVTN